MFSYHFGEKTRGPARGGSFRGKTVERSSLTQKAILARQWGYKPSLKYSWHTYGHEPSVVRGMHGKKAAAMPPVSDGILPHRYFPREILLRKHTKSPRLRPGTFCVVIEMLRPGKRYFVI